MWHIFQLPGIHSSGQDYSTLTYKTSQWSFSSPSSPLSLFASFHLDLQLLNMGEVKKTTFTITRTISGAASVSVQQKWPEAWVILGWLVKKFGELRKNCTIWWYNQSIIISTTRRRLYWYGRCLWFSWGSGLLGNQVIRVFLFFSFFLLCILYLSIFVFYFLIFSHFDLLCRFGAGFFTNLRALQVCFLLFTGLSMVGCFYWLLIAWLFICFLLFVIQLLSITATA